MKQHLGKLVVLIVITVNSLIPLNKSVALSEPTLVIIDTGIDSSLQIFQSTLIQEVCVLDFSMCPNGMNYQEGLGAATIRGNFANLNGFDHGTQMASIAVNSYPNLKFIFMRVIANNAYGNRLPVSNGNVVRALTWVQTNREKYNIKAIAMSQGNHQLTAGIKYCPSFPEVTRVITQLKRDGVATFFPTGNAGDKRRIDWPACIPDSIAVGSVNEKDEIPNYSNMDFLYTDMYALGASQAIVPGGRFTTATGTSVSTQIAAVQWIQFANRYPEATYAQIYQSFRRSGKIVFDANFKFGVKIDLTAALLRYENQVKEASTVSGG